jgi:hypothetical protein
MAPGMENGMQQVPGSTCLGAQATHPQNAAEVLESFTPERKELATLRARFAICGYTLQVVKRACDGRAAFHVSRLAQTHVFCHAHDLAGFLARLEGHAA